MQDETILQQMKQQRRYSMQYLFNNAVIKL